MFLYYRWAMRIITLHGQTWNGDLEIRLAMVLTGQSADQEQQAEDIIKEAITSDVGIHWFTKGDKDGTVGSDEESP